MIGVILATGPSITPEQLETVRQAQLRGKCMVFGMNHVWKDFPSLDVFLACNPTYYDAQWDKGLSEIKAEKWTWDLPTADKYGIRHIKGRWGDGFSKDKDILHYGHSSGFQLPGIAYHKAMSTLLLLGYDMCFAKDYNAHRKDAGSTPRHYFGEYLEPELQHWPSIKVVNGVFVELIQQFEKVKEINTDIEIINCSPGSAMKCFPMMELEDAL